MMIVYRWMRERALGRLSEDQVQIARQGEDWGPYGRLHILAWIALVGVAL